MDKTNKVIIIRGLCEEVVQAVVNSHKSHVSSSVILVPSVDGDDPSDELYKSLANTEISMQRNVTTIVVRSTARTAKDAAEENNAYCRMALRYGYQVRLLGISELNMVTGVSAEHHMGFLTAEGM